MNGLLQCSRYAFGPNRLHYCGPDASQEILAYIDNKEQDPGLEKLLSAFQTLYPYLEMISRANNIADPFDERVVEAYWIGNDLLANTGKKHDLLSLSLFVRLNQLPSLFSPLSDC